MSETTNLDFLDISEDNPKTILYINLDYNPKRVFVAQQLE